MCSPFAKPYDIIPIPPLSYIDKKRVYRISSEHFPENPGEGDIEMSQAVIDNNFQVDITPPATNFQLNYIGSNLIELYFSEFRNNMKITFSLKNATLRENYVTDLDSDPVKVLI